MEGVKVMKMCFSVFVKWVIVFLTLFTSSLLFASNPQPDKRFKADILVIVAHPDDESIIAGYLARAVLDEHKKAAVVIITNGNAGQNLVGYEQARSLAEIRKIEAQRALASIGVHLVWFLNAPDNFAYDATDVLRSLESWNHGKILEDVVRFIRLTRPEVVITMLPDVVVGENHEDHQAAGVIATEAFDIAGNPTWFPEQIAAPEDRLWFANLREGLHTWQPEKLYYFTDATQLSFVKGNGPVYSMTAVSPSRHVSYAVLAAKEMSFHKSQYGDFPDNAIKSGDLKYFNQPLTFIFGKSLVGGSVTGDLFENVVPGPIPFKPVRGYRPIKNLPDYSIELGGGWAFYKNFWPAHNLKLMPDLLQPEIGVNSGQNFPVTLLLHNNTGKEAVFELNIQIPPGWAVDSSSALFAHHHLKENNFIIAAHDSYPLLTRLVAPVFKIAKWQNVTWSVRVGGKPVGSVTLKLYVRRQR